jgi:ATP-binding cassette subfamily F protein uup
MMPVKALSGGERNRVILAKLFTRPANLLVLDEPTNDLDIETLEVLERKLREYKGTLIVVTHDREFLDNVVTSTVVFEDDGKIKEYVGGYKDWLRQGHQLTERDNPDFVAARRKRAAERKLNNIRTKLSYKDQRELDQLPADIKTLEDAIAALQEAVSSQDFYSQEQNLVQAKLQELAGAEQELEKSVERWGELESLKESYQLRD